jgi:hypothetical protein
MNAQTVSQIGLVFLVSAIAVLAFSIYRSSHGMPSTGLSSLGTVLETLTGYRLGKAHTFTNWDARPLTPAQLGYAADDVRYMHLIWSELSARLSSLGRADWAMSESREQLRVLEHGHSILCAVGEAHFTGIDPPEQSAAFVERRRAAR